MSKIKQSLAWWCFGRHATPEELIKRAKQIGYEGVEMVPQELWAQVRAGGLRVVTEGGHNGISSGFNRLENHDRVEAEILGKLELAKANDVHALIVFSGERKGMSDEEGLKNTIIGLKRVAKAAEEAKVTLVMELLNSKVDHADYQCDHTNWGVEVCKAVSSPRIKLLYDIYHMQIMEGDIIRTLRDHIEYIGHFHTAGNPGRNELDESQELYYPAIMRAIATTNYEGYVGQEFSPKNEAFASLEAAFKICDVSGFA